MRDLDERFHQEWLGLAQPSEGLVFSVPVLADAQITPHVRRSLTDELREFLREPSAPRAQPDEGPPDSDAELAGLTAAPAAGPVLRDLRAFFRGFLGYSQHPEQWAERDALPAALSFHAPEGQQELRPSFAILDLPDAADASAPPAYLALVWDLADDTGPDVAPTLSLDKTETTTGAWSYTPTAKLERLLRHAGVPVGFVSNGRELRLVYAPAGETSAHLTFRVSDMLEPAGRPILAALELLFHARRTYGAAREATFTGLLAESRRRQADVTHELAQQVFEAVELLVQGFEAASLRDGKAGVDWLRAALEGANQDGIHDPDHFYNGVLSVVLRLVFLLYAEDTGLLPVDHEVYAAHLSVGGLYEDLLADAGAHPESMHHRFGAYGRLLALFRAVYLGVSHGSLLLPPRRGRLFDPNEYPFLEGGLPGWTSPVQLAEARAEATPPSLDDGTLHRVLRRLVVFKGQRLSYRTLDVEQIGSVYESLMGFHVLRVESPAVRLGKHGVWVELDALRALRPSERQALLKEQCGLSAPQIKRVEDALKLGSPSDVAEAVLDLSPGGKAKRQSHFAEAGRLVLQPGEERRRSGSHYTPRVLTEKVVRRTLEPILACLGPAPTASQILQLKVCDPAMGSGAFLVEACRFLAEQLVAAWTRSGELTALAHEHGEPLLFARRLVAQRCLYGVDKNAAAVELGKLSLWLVTLSRTLPFTFLDHCLRHGDSLVGLDLSQIRAFHWAPSPQLETCSALLTDALDQALEHRANILELASRDDTPSQREKTRLLEYAEQATARVRLLADVCVGAFFAQGKDKARQQERDRRLALVQRFFDADAGEDARGQVEAELRELAAVIRAQHAPFHWMIEFPEVFYQERPDPLAGGETNGAAFMEAFVGNPPFMGGSSVSLRLGDSYRDWLLAQHKDSHGNSDLAAHFFRRVAVLLGSHGAYGLISTNTIAQGDTRATGLMSLLASGWRIYDATSSMVWPGAAVVTVSIVHGARGMPARSASCLLDAVPVETINSRLRPKPERAEPTQLQTARSVTASLGTRVDGAGFILTPIEREHMIELDTRNGEVISPYIGGEEVNTNPEQLHDRYVINFRKMAVETARHWQTLMARVEATVRPAREQVRTNTGMGGHGKKYWWQFTARRDALYAALEPLNRCLVTSSVSKHLVFAFQPTDRIFAHSLYVFPLSSDTAFAILQSRVHEPWARLLCSSLEDRLRYAASDCFETFSFPEPDPGTVIATLEILGAQLYEARAQFMRDTDQGLTKTYNALKDPANEDAAILHLRQLHEQMDRAVLDAYGWKDLAVPPYCPKTSEEKHALEAFKDEVIDRLYALNEARAREERRLGLGKAGKGGAGGGKGAGKPAAKGKGKKATSQGGLFE